jgi:2-oxoglutarate ferredoxin oxidoreductase subunit beta
VIRLRKLAPDYDASNRIGAMSYVQSRYAEGEIVTGLLYLEPDPRDLHGSLNTVAVPLNQLGERELCPGAAALEKLNASMR